MRLRKERATFRSFLLGGETGKGIRINLIGLRGNSRDRIALKTAVST